ncbi:hypothetical protein QVG61_06390 [Thiohalobacter sp. IOR34]|uniref:hypothetical protein n=1 Tax=Thiohalobacter sp. IOR34 TaxID=3057176 RepID=UPI0025B19E12|nr:hypothetical protein [Thiohalobacter sp. IOR34]WJW76710.1 hypothetical protein QVG61_06390 [Thiohalobacter sp. IOR34]
MFIYSSKMLKPLLTIGFVFSSGLSRIRDAFLFMKMLAKDAAKLREKAATLNDELRAALESDSGGEAFDPGRKTIFLVVTCGQAVRTILVSGLLGKLRERYNIVIFSPYYRSEHFLNSYKAENVRVLPWFDNYTLRLEFLAAYYHMHCSSSGTLKSIMENIEVNAKQGSSKKIRNAARRQYKMLNFSVLVGKLFGRKTLSGVHQIFLWAVLPHGMFRMLFDRFSPELVLSTAAHHSASWPLTHYAQDQGVVTAAYVISWDNLTTKTLLDEHVDHYLVWSDEMLTEMQEHFPFIEAQAHVVGSPQFDMYFNKEGLVPRDEFVQSMGLNPDLPYILYATNTPIAMPEEPQIIKEYWEAIQKTDLAGKVSLVVRLHPKDMISRYEELGELPDIAITLAGPPEWEGADKWLPDQEIMAYMLNQMAHASVSINVASTMSLEGFCLGLPTLNVAYTTATNKKRENLLWSFEMYHSSDHYKALVDEGAVLVAHSKEELINATKESLKHGATRKEAMQKVLSQKVSYCDGSSSERFSQVIGEIIS